MKQFRKLIDKADTQTKADLISSLAGFFPADRIPKLTKQQGFELIKIQLEQRSKEFKSKIHLLRIGMFFLFAVIIGIILFNVISSVSDNNIENKRKKSKSEKPPMTFIICDFTPSVTESSRAKVFDDALTICDGLFGYSYLYFYRVGNRAYDNPFLKTNLLKEEDFNRRIDLIEYNNSKKDFSDNLKIKMSKFISTDTSKYSCIIGSIEQSIRDFSNYDTSGNTPLCLFLLSDMRESCPYTFYYNDKQATFTNKSGLSFKRFKHLKVFIIVSTQSEGNPEILNKFWKNLFSSYGYDDLPNLSPLLPDMQSIKEN
ncbi:MAG TPA: hypothetical protein VI489_03030 [Candidatus Brocadiaceae bacterium]